MPPPFPNFNFQLSTFNFQLSTFSFQLFLHVPIPILPFVMAWDLGDGEAAVLTLAESITDAFAVLDDQAARHCARAMGIKSIGTLGLILMAKQTALIPSARQALNDVISAGLFISQHHVDSILRLAGE